MVSNIKLKRLSSQIYEDLTNNYKKLKETRKHKGVGQSPSSYDVSCSICGKENKLAFMVYDYQRKVFSCINCYMDYLDENIDLIREKRLTNSEDHRDLFVMSGDPETDDFLKEYLVQASSQTESSIMGDADFDEDDLPSNFSDLDVDSVMFNGYKANTIKKLRVESTKTIVSDKNSVIQEKSEETTLIEKEYF